MISLEQIQLLESRVMKAVRRIETLQSENDTLRERLERYEKRIQELEILINEFKDGQSEIEQGIMNALSQLDNLEDQVTDSEMRSSTTQKEHDSVPGASHDASAKDEQPPETGTNEEQSTDTSASKDRPNAEGFEDEHDTGSERSAELDIF